MDLALEVDLQSICAACSDVHGWHVSSLNWLPNWRDKFYNLGKVLGQFLIPVYNVRILMLRNKEVRHWINCTSTVMVVSKCMGICYDWAYSKELSIMWQWVFSLEHPPSQTQPNQGRITFRTRNGGYRIARDTCTQQHKHSNAAHILMSRE